jgi:branched-chain amino acid transport system permease protein
MEQAIGGLTSGGVFAALGVCVVFMYRMLGVVNFALASIGALGASIGLEFYAHGWGLPLALVFGMLGGLAISAVVGVVMATIFLEASVELRSTVTIALFVASMAVGNFVLGGSAHNFPELLGSASVSMFGAGVPVGSLIECIGAVVLAAVLGAVLRFTRLGLQLRAVAARPVTAQLMGVRAGLLTVVVWAFAGAVAAFAIMLVLPTSTSSFSPLAILIVPALAAALLAVFRSMVVAAVAGVGIGMLESLALNWGILGNYTQALPFVLIIVVMMWWRRKDVWADAR